MLLKYSVLNFFLSSYGDKLNIVSEKSKSVSKYFSTIE